MSVVRTDVLQGVLMVVGALLLFGFVTHAAGGVGVIGQLGTRPDTTHLTELNAAIPFVVLVGITLAGSLKLLVDPRQVTRFYGLRDARSIRTGMWIAGIGILVVQFSLLPVGLYARFLLDGVTDTDVIVPLLVTDPDVFPALVGDFLVVAILAAAMSSLDSVLLVAASVVVRDIRMELGPLPDRSAIAWTRWGVIGFAVLGAAIALESAGRHRRDHDLLGQLVRGVLHPHDRHRPALAPRQRDRCARGLRDRHCRAGRVAVARLAGAPARGLSGARRVDPGLHRTGADHPIGRGRPGRGFLPPVAGNKWQ